MGTKRININKVVKVEGNTITVLESAFEYEDGFKGLTGTMFEVVTEDGYWDRVEELLEDPSALSEYWHDLTGEYLSYDQVINISSDEEEIKNLLFDTSYEGLWDYIREELNLSEDEAYIFNCIGGGRCFTAQDKFTHNKELEKYLIYETER